MPITSQPIRRDEVYALPDFLQRVNLTRHGLRQARRNGLDVAYVHGRCFVTGESWLRYLERVGKPTKDEARSDV